MHKSRLPARQNKTPTRSRTSAVTLQATEPATARDAPATANGHAHPADDVATSSRSGGESPGGEPTEEEALDMSAVHLASVLSADLDEMPKGELSSE